MSSAEEFSIDPSLMLIFPLEGPAIKEDLSPDAAWRYYSHSIRRNPNDLALHTHRVFFAMNHKDALLLPGSLHDLFYILKDSGEALRIRLLKASIPFLSKKDTLYFAMWLKKGTHNGMGYQWLNGSVLADGLFGPDEPLITMESNDEKVGMSPLEEARSSMEYGQLDLAQKILNDALAINPDDKALLDELEYLEGYIKSREINPIKTPPKEGLLKKLRTKLFS